ncbi:MAG: transglycosylase SLT domain-containing protein [Nitrospira sp.]
MRVAHGGWHVLTLCLRAIHKAPPTIQVWSSVAIIVAAALTINWIYHAYYKPTELFFPVEPALQKSPRETWKEYGSLFETHSTAIITPELLAAIAQAEGSGNPVARTYWKWRVTSQNPLDWYRPASTAVGMFQITDGTFQEGKRYCIHNHVVVEEGPWNNFNSCWFNSLYSRVIPGHAMELTAALLDRQVNRLIGDQQATFEQKQQLAAVIHLCGAGVGRTYIKHNYRLTPHQQCGAHDLQTYLLKISALKQQFTFLKGQ